MHKCPPIHSVREYPSCLERKLFFGVLQLKEARALSWDYLPIDSNSKTNPSAQQGGKMEKRPGCHALNSTLSAPGPEKAQLAPTYGPASTFQRPGLN